MNSLMAWVVGLISPIWWLDIRVNQRLPSGPAVICRGPSLPDGRVEHADGVGGRVDHPDRVGAWLGEPEVAVGAGRDPRRTGIGGGDGERADGVSGRVDHPDRVGAGLGEPEVAVGTGRDRSENRLRWMTATAGERELGDRGNAREQATLFQPFEPKLSPASIAGQTAWTCAAEQGRPAPKIADRRQGNES